MRIDNSQKMRIAQEFQNQVRKNEESKRGSMNKADEIVLGKEANEVQELVNMLKEREIKRLEKVEKTMEEIHSGTYRVTGRDVLLKVMEERRNGFGTY